MRTIESGRAVVEIIVWPENKPWENRYRTVSSIKSGICTLTLSQEVFHNAAKANTAYRRFSRKIRENGMEPPELSFRTMTGNASGRIFCILSDSCSVFNSACPSGKLCVFDTGIDSRRSLMAVLQN